MKTHYFKHVWLLLMFGLTTQAQTGTPSVSTTDSLAGFDRTYWTSFYNSHSSAPSPSGLNEFITSHQKEYIQSTYFPLQRAVSSAPMPQQACTNIDFETGNLNGWTSTTGFHPLFNVIGCCPAAGGAQFITSGAATDPCGGFPVVAPGGTFSLRLGDNNTGGHADRIEQTFAVTPANANFTYKYAVVFEDPGHSVAEQPSFQIEMLDSLGNQIPCTYYNVAAGQGVPGFQTSGCAGVIFKPWTNVSVDLTNFIGQNVTIRFTTYDCALGGHYGYAYIDGSCLNFSMTQNGILCQGSTVQVSAPVGFASYTWVGPNNTSYTGQTITTGTPGTYTVNMVTVTGCPGPTLTYNLVEYPKPVADFTSAQATPCTPLISFTNNSSVTSGSIISYQWSMGNGTSATGQNTSQSYANGTYSVNMICTTNMGCQDTIQKIVTVSPPPIVAFSAPDVCSGTNTAFTNNSSVSTGYIASYNWQFGDGASAASIAPTHAYSTQGTYNVTLTATSDKNCVASASQPITIFPLPTVQFSAANVCDGVAMNFTNNTSVSTGGITNYLWDFNADGMPDNTNQNPAYTYTGPGNYNVQLTAISDHNCLNTHTMQVTVYQNPVAQFTLTNICDGVAMTYTNLSSVPAGHNASYAWNFGDNNTSAQQNPQHVYNTYGNYYVTLTVTSDQNCSSSISSVGVVYPVPNVAFASTTACENQATQFTNLSSIAAGTIVRYRWDFDNNGIIDDSTSNPSYIYPSAGTIQSRLMALSNSNCVNQAVKPVTVHFNPVPNFSAPSTCMPDNTIFTNLSTSSDGLITSYQWDFNGDNIMDNYLQNPTYSFAQLGSHAVKLEVQTQYGCTNTIIKSAYVNPKPSVQFAAVNNLGCPSLCVNFTNSSSIGSGQIVTYQWLFGDNSAPDFSQSPTHCFATGQYNITLKAISDSGCFNSQTIPNLVTVYPVPVADFSIEPGEVEITTPMITVESKAIGASSVNYYFNDGTTKNTPDFTHTFNTDVAKTVLIMQVVTNAYGCKDSIIKPVTIKPAYALYIPNAFTPNEDGVNDGFRAVGIGIATFKMWIFDRWGHVIFQTDDINKAWDGSVNGKGDYDSTKEDVYVWKAEVTDVLMQKHDLIGHVSIVK
ncbi:MAG: PKD domain-containing protein [Bacteroidetes bacterium]|nr:PKD domain-containing protein [Bacteroidota bacterium]